MNKISVYCEIDNFTRKINDVSFELITKACELKQQAKALNDENVIIEAIVLGSQIDEEDKILIKKYGANKLVFLKELSLLNFSQTVYSHVFGEYIIKNPTDIILFGATAKGRILAPRITTLLNVGLVADCTDLELIMKNDKIQLASTRPTFGSQLMATILSKVSPQCATVRAGVFNKKEIENENFEYIELTPNSYSELRAKLVNSTILKEKKEINLENAKIILCAGYGINTKDREYYNKLKEIAKRLDLTYAVTRKVVDYNIEAKEFQIGQTGNTVKPELYISFGVSGAIQHIFGMKNSKKIIAINTDENAEIFNYCDYKIVNDAKAIIDEIYELTKQLII